MDILKTLLEKIEQNQQKIDQFFQRKFSNPLFYNSVDLRHSGFKIAPVDVNCFPAGFNNLSCASRDFAKKIVADFLKKNFPSVKKILILPESHTRNFRYLENVLVLQEIIAGVAGIEVKIGSLIADIQDVLSIDLENGKQIPLEKLVRNGDKIFTQSGFCPDLIIANNDFTDGVAEILQNLTQPIIPSVKLGWYVRKKSVHFDVYNKVVAEFCEIIDLDPWLISTMHRHCDDVDFKERKGVKCLAKYVDELIANLKEKYQQYGINAEPYCYIKADNGTYGMAIMTVKSGAELLELNKKDRNKMSSIKGSIQNTTAIIQEGVITKDLIKHMIAEPMIYLMAGEVVGDLFRVNDARDENISLNAAGMSFYDLSDLSDNDLQIGLTKSEVKKVYNMIARLSALAASLENPQ
ncbi:MAG: putative glutamate--cysteine ligase [Rickettsiaceae bacterium]|jgi:glutamate--cysteine ligase|nr:putative glutamate--cysteine ligase [Rickettsiaceae bacterium]